MKEVAKLPQARRDIMQQANYYAEKSLNLSDRFLEAVQETLRKIALMPGIGSPRDYNSPQYDGLRVVLIPKFNKMGIYYRVVEDAILVVRVLHGARDIESLFAPEKE